MEPIIIPDFDVQLKEGKMITNQLVCEIYAIRHEPTLRIIVNINNELKKLPYKEITKLACIKEQNRAHFNYVRREEKNNRYWCFKF